MFFVEIRSRTTSKLLRVMVLWYDWYKSVVGSLEFKCNVDMMITQLFFFSCEKCESFCFLLNDAHLYATDRKEMNILYQIFYCQRCQNGSLARFEMRIDENAPPGLFIYVYNVQYAWYLMSGTFFLVVCLQCRKFKTSITVSSSLLTLIAVSVEFWQMAFHRFVSVSIGRQEYISVLLTTSKQTRSGKLK